MQLNSLTVLYARTIHFLVASSLVLNFAIGSHHLFDIGGFHEQYFLFFGYLLDMILLYGHPERPDGALCGLGSCILWSTFLIWKKGQFQDDFAFFPFYAYLLVHYLAVMILCCADFSARKEPKDDFDWNHHHRNQDHIHPFLREDLLRDSRTGFRYELR